MKGNKKLNLLIEKLKNDPIRNSNLIGFIEENDILRIEEFGNSCLVQGVSDRLWTYFSSESKDEFRHLMEMLKGEDENFAVLEDWMLSLLLEKFKLDIELTTMKLVLPDDVVIPEPTIDIIPLTSHYAEYIYNNYSYQNFTTAEYIRDRIEKGGGGGIFVNDKLAAWVLTQDDGAIGLLHVLDEFRRKGYAKELTHYQIQQVRNKGRVPFVQIEERNFKSLNLSKKIGFKEYKKVHWATLCRS